ncbi:hypothetical protein ACHHYP_20062 [Achlya hypogyna]|uniref:Uncharacterized protein n=1 Tax=Achlya hypogyna TaxID=1202772 RepID=A0A1V9ZTK2_ACHHY|nr:hypothetical protein ACHHYP_20062 [Achlya hypogyna]
MGALPVKGVIRIDPMQLLLGLRSGDYCTVAEPGIYVPLDLLKSLDTSLPDARESADVTNQDILTQVSLQYPFVFSTVIGVVAAYALKSIGHIVGIFGIAAVATSEGLVTIHWRRIKKFFALDQLLGAPPQQPSTLLPLNVVEIWDALTKTVKKEQRPRRPRPHVDYAGATRRARMA